MIEKKFNDSWKFWVDKEAFSLIWNIPEAARDITLPHDAMIEKSPYAQSKNEGNTGFRDGEVYCYVKIMKAPAAYRDKTVMLKFEGVYMNAFVYVNGQLAGKCPFGYSTFFVPLNDYLKYGEDNEIRVQVRNGAMTNSRWYTGGGIYRDVYLLVSDLCYMAPEGVQIKTESADEELAVIQINSELHNRYHTPVSFVLETVIEDIAGNTVACDKIPVVLLAGERRKTSRRVTVCNPKLWSDMSPNLYICKSKMYQEDRLLDESVNNFGIRTLLLDSQRGLRVNAKPVNLRGACLHHDSGLIGAATYEDAQFRQIKLLKNAGFNAIRMSHHPMAPAMLRACDYLGMYVMDETFDMWNRCKSDYDYGLFFSEWWENDVTAMVLKDYNHPSVIMYSVGNEIPEIGTPYGAKLCHDICEKIKTLDDTRFTLASINGVFAAGDAVDQVVADVAADLQETGEMKGNVNNFMTLMDEHMDKIVVHPAISKRLELACAWTDIAGYNYMTGRYEMDGELYPNRIIVGSETYPPDIARNWDIVEKSCHVIGDFTWTGWDYIGEAGVGVPAYTQGEGGFEAKFPCQLAYCGDIDITGFRRPASYFREIVFGLSDNPHIAVQNPHKYGEPLIKTPWVMSDSTSSWTWRGFDGKPIIAEVYSPGTEVELFLNGMSLGKKPAGKDAGYKTLFDITYEPGILTAVTYDNGIEIGRSELKTAGKNCKIVLKPEDSDYRELIYIAAEICDEDGNVVTDEEKTLELHVEGGADAIGFGSGNPKPKYNYIESISETFHGRALIILKKNGLSGQAEIHVSSRDGLNSHAVLNI